MQNNYVVAVDQRGHGRTTGWDNASYDDTDLDKFSLRQYVTDMVALVYGLGYKSVRCIIGHGFGAEVAAMCALIRPDFFKSCILISRPFNGIADLPLDTSDNAASGHSPRGTGQQWRDRSQGTSRTAVEERDVHFALAQLDPPRKHHRWYNSFQGAANEWRYPPQGLHSFLRGYFHLLSADFEGTKPLPLQNSAASELSKLPNYYIMPLGLSMPEIVSADMDTQAYDKTKTWLGDDDLAVYVQEYSRTGFQGALNYFRVATDQDHAKQLTFLAGARIEVPITYVSGNCDWGNFEEPGVLQSMPKFCKDFRGVKIIRDAGHWPQQEQPGALAAEILKFLWSIEHQRPRASSQVAPTRTPHNTNTPSPPKQSTSPTRFRGISPPVGRDSPNLQDRSITGQMLRRSSLSNRGRPGTEPTTSDGAPQERLASQGAGQRRPSITRAQSLDILTNLPAMKDAAKDSPLAQKGYHSAASPATKDQSVRRRAHDPDTPHPDSIEQQSFPPLPPSQSRLTNDETPKFPSPPPPPPARRTQPSNGTSSSATLSRAAMPALGSSPDEAIDASERNAEIYKQVSEQARRKLEEAEKHFRRMGKEVITRRYDGGSDDQGHTNGRNRTASSGNVRNNGSRLQTPFEADMEVGPPTPGMRR